MSIDKCCPLSQSIDFVLEVAKGMGCFITIRIVGAPVDRFISVDRCWLVSRCWCWFVGWCRCVISRCRDVSWGWFVGGNRCGLVCWGRCGLISRLWGWMVSKGHGGKDGEGKEL